MIACVCVCVCVCVWFCNVWVTKIKKNTKQKKNHKYKTKGHSNHSLQSNSHWKNRFVSDDRSNDTIGRWNQMNDNNIERNDMAKIHTPPVRRKSKSSSIPPDVFYDESKSDILNDNANETSGKEISKDKDKTGDFDMTEIETNKTMSKQQIRKYHNSSA